MKTKSKKSLITALVIILILAAFLVSSECFYTVGEDEYVGVIRFAKTVDTVSEPGLHFKLPFTDSVRRFPKKVLLYDMKPSEVLTADSKTMQVDNYVLWRITDPLTFYKTLGTMNEAETRIDMLTYSAIKTEMGKSLRDDIINQDDMSRELFNNNILAAATGATDDYGIEIIDIKIKKLDLPSDNEEAVYRRMISERSKIAEQYRADGNKEAEMIRNEVDKQKNILISDAKARAEQIKAEGEAEYMRILADAYNTPEKQDFYSFTRALDAVKVSLDGDDVTIILGKDSALADALLRP